MKTSYEAIKNFPKVLYSIEHDGTVKPYKVKEAHYVGKCGIEINLGGGSYIYQNIGSYKRNYVVHEYTCFDTCYFDYYRYRGFYVSEKYAIECAQRYKEEKAHEENRRDFFKVYTAAKKAHAHLSFDFTK